jgi:hypothetical protein
VIRVARAEISTVPVDGGSDAKGITAADVEPRIQPPASPITNARYGAASAASATARPMTWGLPPAGAGNPCVTTAMAMS